MSENKKKILPEKYELFQEYFKLKKEISNYSKQQLKALPFVYRSFLNLENEIKGLVLTGEELIKIYMGFSEDIGANTQDLIAHEKKETKLKDFLKKHEGEIINDIQRILNGQ